MGRRFIFCVTSMCSFCSFIIFPVFNLGAGKTWPCICLPQVLDILRDEFTYNIQKDTRILYIVPLVNIYHSLEMEMSELRIAYQILRPGVSPKIKPFTKVVCVSPEKILDSKVVQELGNLSWSCICIDEPHLALLWGTSKSKSKPFREAFSKLCRLNNLSTCFEVHSATIFDEMDIFELLGRKNSDWSKQIQIPNRKNFTIYLQAGKNAPSNILAMPSVKRAFDDENGLLLVFVQRISDGVDIHLRLLEFCEQNDHINYNPKEAKPNKPLAFLHSSLSEETKNQILTDAQTGKLRVPISTNSAGCGINIPVTGFIGWGLDPESCGIIQAM